MALDLPVAERDTWIDSLADANEELKATLRQMVRTEPDPDSPRFTLLDGHLDAALRNAAAAADSGIAGAGARVGPYELIREIGRGGMGAVWLARRVEGLTRRAVALKLPHPGLFNTELAQRIERERDILESLAHPNIARIYDAGVSAAGQPYLALEYIEGTPITDYCDARQLDTRSRVVLAQQILGALQYAHAQLVIHRDLKPANILVTSDGRAMLLDFGIAKLLTEGDAGQTALTRIGGRALTPDYASPEQIAGQTLSTASDVYSIGVVLYELLAGQRPYKMENSISFERAFEKIVVARPSSVAKDTGARKFLQGDLDTILLKALKFPPGERYSTIAALSEDLDRHLRGDPVLARPDTAWYRIRKFAERNTLAVSAVAAVVTALAVGMSLAMWQAHVARQSAERAEQVKSFALSLLTSADPDAGARVSTTAVDLLQDARKRVANELADRPGIAAELMTTIGSGLIGQDRPNDAAPLLKKAIELSSQANGPDDVRTLEASVAYGQALYILDHVDEAIATLKAAATRAHRVHEPHVEINAWRVISQAYVDLGNKDAAIDAGRRSVAAVPATGEMTDRRLLTDALSAHKTLAQVLHDTVSPGAVDEARIALRYAEQFGSGPKPIAAIEARSILGLGLVRDGQLTRGLEELKRAYVESREILGDDHSSTANAANFLGEACLRAGDVRCGLSAMQAAHDSIMRQQATAGPYTFAMYQYGLAHALFESNRFEEALPLFDQAGRLFTQAGGPDAPFAVRSREDHAYSMLKLGRLEEADAEFAALAAIPRSVLEKAIFDSRLAGLRSVQGRHSEAVALARSAVEGSRSSTLEALRGKILLRYVKVLMAAHQPQEALQPLQEALALLRKTQLPQSPYLAEANAALEQVQAVK